MSSESEYADAFELSSTQAAANNPELLNKNHRNQVGLTFQHIDSILTDIEQILLEPERGSPFARYGSDITAVPRVTSFTKRSANSSKTLRLLSQNLRQKSLMPNLREFVCIT
jgi:hypothetical protein